MNHSPYPDAEMQKRWTGLYEQFEEASKPAQEDRRLGPTGRFPEGKLTKQDEGEIQFGVAADHDQRKVLINFNSPVAWLGMNPDQAVQLGALLIAKAKDIRKGRRR